MRESNNNNNKETIYKLQIKWMRKKEEESKRKPIGNKLGIGGRETQGAKNTQTRNSLIATLF